MGKPPNKGEDLGDDLEDVLLRNGMNLQETLINEVRAFGQEVRMINIHNRKPVDGD